MSKWPDFHLSFEEVPVKANIVIVMLISCLYFWETNFDKPKIPFTLQLFWQIQMKTIQQEPQSRWSDSQPAKQTPQSTLTTWPTNASSDNQAWNFQYQPAQSRSEGRCWKSCLSRCAWLQPQGEGSSWGSSSGGGVRQQYTVIKKVQIVVRT